MPLYCTEHTAEPVGHRDPAKSCGVPRGSKPLLGFGCAGLNGWVGWRSKPPRGRAGLMGIWRGHVGQRFWGREREQAVGKLRVDALSASPAMVGGVQKTNTNVPEPMAMWKGAAAC